MYILDDKKEVYKMRMILEEEYREVEEELMSFDISIPRQAIQELTKMINCFIDTIPFHPAYQYSNPLVEKYDKYFGNYYIFKCRKGRFNNIFLKFTRNDLRKHLSGNDELIKDIEDYLLLHKDMNYQF